MAWTVKRALLSATFVLTVIYLITSSHSTSTVPATSAQVSEKRFAHQTLVTHHHYQLTMSNSKAMSAIDKTIAILEKTTNDLGGGKYDEGSVELKRIVEILKDIKPWAENVDKDKKQQEALCNALKSCDEVAKSIDLLFNQQTSDKPDTSKLSERLRGIVEELHAVDSAISGTTRARQQIHRGTGNNYFQSGSGIMNINDGQGNVYHNRITGPVTFGKGYTFPRSTSCEDGAKSSSFTDMPEAMDNGSHDGKDDGEGDDFVVIGDRGSGGVYYNKITGGATFGRR